MLALLYELWRVGLILSDGGLGTSPIQTLTSMLVVERSHAQRADMTCPVVARRYTVVVDIRSTDKAHIRVIVFLTFGALGILDQATT